MKRSPLAIIFLTVFIDLMGLVGAAFGLGFVLGPAIGGLLAPYGYNKPVLLASAMAGLNFIFALFKLPESLTSEARIRAQNRRFNVRALREALSHPRVASLLAMYLVVTFAFSNMEATFALLNEHQYQLTGRQTGYLFTFIGVLMCIMQGFLVGRLVRRMGEKRLIVVGTFTRISGRVI